MWGRARVKRNSQQCVITPLLYCTTVRVRYVYCANCVSATCYNNAVGTVIRHFHTIKRRFFRGGVCFIVSKMLDAKREYTAVRAKSSAEEAEYRRGKKETKKDKNKAKNPAYFTIENHLATEYRAK